MVTGHTLRGGLAVIHPVLRCGFNPKHREPPGVVTHFAACQRRKDGRGPEYLGKSEPAGLRQIRRRPGLQGQELGILQTVGPRRNAANQVLQLREV